MKRLYSNYPEYEFEGIAEKAEEMGLSLSAFQRYCVMVYMSENTPCHDFMSMGFYDSISMRIDRIKVGETFTVADLFPDEWEQFDKSQKMIMAKRLVKFSKNNPHICHVYQSEPGKTTVYLRENGMWGSTFHGMGWKRFY